MTELLHADRVTFTYPGATTPAIEDASLELPEGSFTALLGPNGSGKSTLLALLAGILRAQSGCVQLEGKELSSAPRLEVARQLAYLPSKTLIPADYSAREIVLMARHPFGRGALLEREEDTQRALKALARMDADQFAQRRCDQLSSGERQRVLLARILCQDTRRILLDEPTSAQDLGHVLSLFARFRELAHDQGRTVVVATHALNAAARHADRLIIVKGGRIYTAGAPREVLNPQTLAEVFRVEAILSTDGEVPYAVPRCPSS